MDFGVFLCSACAGIHREMCHKVKGIGMCNFSEKEIEFLLANGNEVSLYYYFVYSYYKFIALKSDLFIIVL
jgi:hypothetical protein